MSQNTVQNYFNELCVVETQYTLEGTFNTLVMEVMFYVF